MDTKQLLEWSDKHLMTFAKRNPVALVRGEGARVWDSDGKGKAEVTVDTKTRKICWEYTGIKGIDKPVATHIHKGKKGAAGPIVVDFMSAKTKGCVTSTKAIVKDVVKNPASYYANIHTAAFPGGARNPHSSVTVSNGPPAADATTGRPAYIASMNTMPNGSGPAFGWQ